MGGRRHGEGTSHLLLVAVLVALSPPDAHHPRSQTRWLSLLLLQISQHWRVARVTSAASELHPHLVPPLKQLQPLPLLLHPKCKLLFGVISLCKLRDLFLSQTSSTNSLEYIPSVAIL